MSNKINRSQGEPDTQQSRRKRAEGVMIDVSFGQRGRSDGKSRRERPDLILWNRLIDEAGLTRQA